MDNNDFYYILMSSLKHPYREHMTKESTSLLMKELDQAASCHISVGGHNHHQQSTSSASTSTAFLPNNHQRQIFNHHQKRNWDGLTFGSPKSPDNVARTILRALGQSDEHTPLTHSAVVIASANAAAGTSTSANRISLDHRRRSTSSGSILQTNAVHLTNGHHRQTPHLHQQQQQQSHHQPSSLLSRCRRRLHLQLTKINGAGSGTGTREIGGGTDSNLPSTTNEEPSRQIARKSRREHLFSKSRQSVVLASSNGNGNGVNGGELHEDIDPQSSSISASDEGATPSSLPPLPHQQFLNWPPAKGDQGFVILELAQDRRQASIVPSKLAASNNSNLSREEHQLIAYNSNLLMVKPSTNSSPSHHPNPSHQQHQNEIEQESGGDTSESASSSTHDSFAPPPPPASKNEILEEDEDVEEDEKETAILDSDTSQSQQSTARSTTKGGRQHFFHRRDTDGGISTIESSSGHHILSSIEHHPPPTSYSQQQLRITQSNTSLSTGNNQKQENRSLLNHDIITPMTSGEPEPSPDNSSIQQQQQTSSTMSGGVGLAVGIGVSEDSTPGMGSSLQRMNNRMCTSFRLKVPLMKNPVDVCLLPNDDIAIADYDNGLLIVNDLGELVDHKKSYHEVNACGVACVRGGSCSPAFRIFLLVVRDGVWTINVYRNFDLVEMARCPTDAQIENWALRRLVVCVDTRLHLLASGETKSTIWTYEFDKGEWRILLTENSGGRKATSGNYNDMSVKYNKDTKETRLVLCEWKKAQLWTLFLNEKTDVMEEKSIKMKRVKGQEWIIQGPHLAVLDEQADILVYDGSGKLFLFDGDSYRCKKIVADLGRGEVSALAAAGGWIYVMCRYRRCIEAFMYKENSETLI